MCLAKTVRYKDTGKISLLHSIKPTVVPTLPPLATLAEPTGQAELHRHPHPLLCLASSSVTPAPSSARFTPHIKGACHCCRTMVPRPHARGVRRRPSSRTRGAFRHHPRSPSLQWKSALPLPPLLPSSPLLLLEAAGPPPCVVVVASRVR